MIAVAFTVSCQRQRYLREAIDSWRAVRGSEDARFLFMMEPLYTFPVAEFDGYLRRTFRPDQWSVGVTERPLGCLRNTQRAMEAALREGAGFGVVAEEDLAVADDVLEYFEWAREEYRRDKQVVAICAHTRSSKLPDNAAVTRAPWFNPLVWGTWQDRWDEVIGPEWGAAEGNPESWDRKLMGLCRDRKLESVFPAQSRSVHRGEVSTQYTYELGRQFWPSSVSTCFRAHYEPQAYKEVPFPIEPGDLVV